MTSQDVLLSGGPLVFPLFEEENPPEAIAGETKTKNLPPNEPQRDVVTYRNVNSDFSVSVEMVLCVHGWEKPDRNQAMTLMIFDYRVIYTKRDHYVKSVRTTFTFDEAAFPAESRVGEGRADPEVVAYAPFERLTTWNLTEADVKDQSHGDAKLGVNYIGVTAELSGGGQREASHKQKYFTQGQASRQYNNRSRKWNTVFWFLQQNDSQGDGVPATFSVAVLLKRATNANFMGTFDIRLEAGLWENLKSGTRRMFGIEEDAPLNFDPESKENGTKWENYKEKIDQENLGALANNEELTKLVKVWGLDLGAFEPLR